MKPGRGVRGSRAGDVGHCFRWSEERCKGSRREIGRRMRRLGGLTWFGRRMAESNVTVAKHRDGGTLSIGFFQLSLPIRFRH